MICRHCLHRARPKVAHRTPSAQKINEFFTSKGNQIFNDHVAFRTFDDPRVNIEVLAKPFIAASMYSPLADSANTLNENKKERMIV